MRIYIESNLMYGFDRQRIFKAGYIVKNIRSSQEYKRYGKSNIGQEGLLSMKSKWDKNYCIVPFRPGSQACECTHFLSYNYHATNLGIDSRFNHEL